MYRVRENPHLAVGRENPRRETRSYTATYHVVRDALKTHICISGSRGTSGLRVGSRYSPGGPGVGQTSKLCYTVCLIMRYISCRSRRTQAHTFTERLGLGKLLSCSTGSVMITLLGSAP